MALNDIPETAMRVLDQEPHVIQYFTSINGEGKHIGKVATYIRVSRCNLNCKFCDTNWGHKKGLPSVYDRDLGNELAEQIFKHRSQDLVVTGGEILMYVKSIANIFHHMQRISNNAFRHYDLESNGILLAKEEVAIELLKQFNDIHRAYGVRPMITISPKYDAAESWEHMSVTQDDVNAQYRQALINSVEILAGYPVVYKFVYDYTDKIIPFENTEYFINLLINKGIPYGNIMLMPLTPSDPLGEGSEFWKESKDATARKALELGLRYSPRIHVDRRLD